ncbi:MAG: hypothetical protein V2J24_09705 [Pseudomonadales bacterium]|jgi:3-hydroxyacyl-CoA dehydrogenase|nr:hypothetical protein [Pseudomonadales bacterium]
MFWADKMGLDAVLKKIEGFREKYGHFWTPAPLLEQLAKEGKTFVSLGAVA